MPLALRDVPIKVEVLSDEEEQEAPQQPKPVSAVLHYSALVASAATLKRPAAACKKTTCETYGKAPTAPRPKRVAKKAATKKAPSPKVKSTKESSATSVNKKAAKLQHTVKKPAKNMKSKKPKMNTNSATPPSKETKKNGKASVSQKTNKKATLGVWSYGFEYTRDQIMTRRSGGGPSSTRAFKFADYEGPDGAEAAAKRHCAKMAKM